MALELLSGPHPVVDGYTGDPVENLHYSRIVYIDPLGIFGHDAVHTIRVTQLDGTSFDTGWTGTVTFIGYGLSLLNGSPDSPYVGDRWYSTLRYIDVGICRELLIDRVIRVATTELSSNAPQTSNAYARVHDRYLGLIGSWVRSKVDADAPDWENELDFSDIGTFGTAAFMSWGKERGTVWIGSLDGEVVLYDYVNKVAASPILKIGVTSSVQGLFYSAKHDVFVSLHRTEALTFETRVWSRHPLPVSITAPEATTYVAAGRKIEVTTSVLGSEGEPCPGEVVTWELVGEGSLQAEATLTDENGVASNYLTIPVEAVGPTLQINVSVITP